MPRPLQNFSRSEYGLLLSIYSHTSWQIVQFQISWLLQKPADLDLHCLQRQGTSGFRRTRVILYAFLQFLSCFKNTCFRLRRREEKAAQKKAEWQEKQKKKREKKEKLAKEKEKKIQDKKRKLEESDDEEESEEESESGNGKQGQIIASHKKVYLLILVLITVFDLITTLFAYVFQNYWKTCSKIST